MNETKKKHAVRRAHKRNKSDTRTRTWATVRHGREFGRPLAATLAFESWKGKVSAIDAVHEF